MNNSEQSAFPSGETQHDTPGLTKREYFATMALCGICAKPNVGGSYSDNAEVAIGLADALLKALEKSI